MRSLAVGLLALVLLPGACASRGASNSRVRVLPPVEVHGVWHRLEPGESLQQLARRYDVPLVDIEEINGIDHRTPQSPGRLLFVPRPPRTSRPVADRADRPRRGTAVERRSTKPPVTARGQLGWPVHGGKISSPFGRRGQQVHEGVDIAAPEGTAVMAAARGEVIYAGSGIRGYGNLIIVRHRELDLVTVYAHNRRNLVERGTLVHQGDVIAEVGRTGRASGSHLHFEVRRGEEPLDPLRLLPPLP